MGFLGWLFAGKDLYVNYEKSFERIVNKSNAILARRYARRQKMQTYSRALWHAFTASVVAGIGHLVWLNRMPAGTLPTQQHITRSALSIIVPLATFILHSAFEKIVSVFESRDNNMLRRLYDSKKKMVQDLKDSTRFEKTMALIRKYSPEDQASLAPSPQPVPIPITPATKQRRQNQPIPTPPSHLFSAAAGAGKALFPMFDSLATNMIGDNPQLVAHLRETQAQLAAEQQRNAALMQQINELQAKYGITSADMSATRQLNAQHESQSPPKSLTFDVQAEEDTSASPSFLTGPFIQPKTLTYSGGRDEGTPESRLLQSVELANGSQAHGGTGQPQAKEEGSGSQTAEGRVPEKSSTAQQKPDVRKSKIPSIMGTASQAAEGQNTSQSRSSNSTAAEQQRAGK